VEQNRQELHALHLASEKERKRNESEEESAHGVKVDTNLKFPRQKL
jgi:hypothetical protein